MLFAPVREQLNRDWATIEQRARAFAEAENDIFQYEALITDLNDAAAEDARAAFRLIRRNFKSGQQFAELLGDIFSRLKKRNKYRRARVLTVKRVFEALEEET